MIKDEYSELASKYDNFIKECGTLAREEILEKAEKLLQDMRESGKVISEPEQRGNLFDKAKVLGRTVFEISGIYPAVRLKQPMEKIEFATEFMDRLSEMQFITNIYCPPYLLLSAPMGYGKTRLVQAVTERLQKQNWFCLHVELWRQKPYSVKELTYNILQTLGEDQGESSELSVPEKYGLEVGKTILKKLHKTQKNVIILIDETESVSEDTAKQFLNQFIPTVKEVLSIYDSSVRLRLILAGRHIFHWKYLDSKIPLELMALTLFDFSAVYQIVENFSVKSNLGFTSDYKQQFASHLMYFTGGHPGCMAKILNKDLGTPIAIIVSNEEEYYKTIVKPVIDEIKAHIPDDLVKIFETLSVVRRFNTRLLRAFTDNGLIEWSESEYELEDLLSQTYLVNKKSGFSEDGVTRHLLAICLRKTDLNHFIRVCEHAVSFYENMLKDRESHRPDIIAAELLFQRLQYIFYKEKGDKEQFFKYLDEILNILGAGRDPIPVMEGFVQVLSEDWEFRFTFNYLLREGVYDGEYSFNELMQKVSDFMDDLHGSNNA